MRVVSNTSPISYLVLIEAAWVLPRLFDEVHIPEAVLDELAREGSPDPLRAWLRKPPAWLRVGRAEPSARDAALDHLHAGEREAIRLTERIGADVLLRDEKAARATAAKRGLRVAGTLGVLDRAGARGLMDVVAAVERLQETNFYATPGLLKWLLDRHP